MTHARWRNGNGGGFSVDASVRIEAADRAGCERLLRYCELPKFMGVLGRTMMLFQLHFHNFDRACPVVFEAMFFGWQ